MLYRKKFLIYLQLNSHNYLRLKQIFNNKICKNKKFKKYWMKKKSWKNYWKTKL